MSKWSNWIIKEKDAEMYWEQLVANGYGPNHLPIYTICEHVSQSGMLRIITAHILMKDDKGVPYPSCFAREYRVGGCGFDAGHDVAYKIYQTLFGLGKEYAERNPDSFSAKALAWWKERGVDDARYQNGLKHRWL